MYYVEIETPDGTKRVQLTRDRMSIGRLSYNDIALPSAQISRQHAELRRVNGEWWIADLHSTNGLHFNTQRIQERRLTPGDSVVLAPGITIYFLSDSPAAAPVRKAEQPLWSAGAASDSPPAPTPSWLAQAMRPGPTRPPAAESDRGMPSSIGMPSGGSASGGSASGGAPIMPAPTGGGARITMPAASGYPAPPGPMNPGGEFRDPYRRSTSGPAQSLLHVCQTCGQRTAPDAVYCQSCHHSIAYECPNCRLSLLPIQERCPRCQSPNPGSVRRAHRHTGI